MVNTSIQQTTTAQVQVNSFIQSVYNWMAIGLGLTGFIAYFVSTSPILKQLLFSNPMIMLVLAIGTIGLVFFLSARIHKISASTATTMFVVYASLNGLFLSSIFLVYTGASIASTFFVCSATFVACSIYGMVTKKDLTSLGGFFFMGLIGIIIASVVNIFLRSPGLYMIISYIGVFVFIGLTAYDTQQLKAMALSQPEGLETSVIRKGAIMGALKLYLDFINMFLFLLRILGNRD